MKSSRAPLSRLDPADKRREGARRRTGFPPPAAATADVSLDRRTWAVRLEPLKPVQFSEKRRRSESEGCLKCDVLLQVRAAARASAGPVRRERADVHDEGAVAAEAPDGLGGAPRGHAVASCQRSRRACPRSAGAGCGHASLSGLAPRPSPNCAVSAFWRFPATRLTRSAVRAAVCCRRKQHPRAR